MSNERIHFIAIGGSAMHSLAIAMDKEGHEVSGSDDAIYEPSKSKLKQHGLFPEELGWYPEKITADIDSVILGMHAKLDNPELLKAQELGLRIYSYPEFLYKVSESKTRVVVAGSHGKTTITAMVLHVLNYHEQETDFMVGATVPGMAETISLSEENDFIILEGDEYLSSPIDLRPKILWYRPQIALISGIAWDHVNVFPTAAAYEKQFELFIESISPGGVLIYNADDTILLRMVLQSKHPIKKMPYRLPDAAIIEGTTYLETLEGPLPLSVFGKHNLSNIAGAQWICQLMGVDSTDFYEAIPSFKGASRRLELLIKGKSSFMFKDFAHAPSKVSATTKAVCEQFKSHRIIACFELHTFSSLDPTFITSYADSLKGVDQAVVFYDPEALKIKKRTPIDATTIRNAFKEPSLEVIDSPLVFQEYLLKQTYTNTVLLLMSSGNYGGLDWSRIQDRILTF